MDARRGESERLDDNLGRFSVQNTLHCADSELLKAESPEKSGKSYIGNDCNCLISLEVRHQFNGRFSTFCGRLKAGMVEFASVEGLHAESMSWGRLLSHESLNDHRLKPVGWAFGLSD